MKNVCARVSSCVITLCTTSHNPEPHTYDATKQVHIHGYKQRDDCQVHKVQHLIHGVRPDSERRGVGVPVVNVVHDGQSGGVDKPAEQSWVSVQYRHAHRCRSFVPVARPQQKVNADKNHNGHCGFGAPTKALRETTVTVTPSLVVQPQAQRGPKASTRLRRDVSSSKQQLPDHRCVLDIPSTRW